MRRSLSLLAATGLAALATVAAPAAPAMAEEVSVPPVCRTFAGPTPGFEVRVGGNYVRVPSVRDLTVCIYRYAVATYGVPTPQFPTDCGTPCVFMATNSFGADFEPYIEVSYKADGVWQGATYTPPPVHAQVDYPVCFSIGDENRPTCEEFYMFNVQQTV